MRCLHDGLTNTPVEGLNIDQQSVQRSKLPGAVRERVHRYSKSFTYSEVCNGEPSDIYMGFFLDKGDILAVIL